MKARLAKKVYVQSGQNVDADVTLVPFQCTQFATLNGTAMVLAITNLSAQNLAMYSATSSGTSFNHDGKIPPFGQETFPPFDFQGTPLVVCNLTNPNKPANIRVILKGVTGPS